MGRRPLSKEITDEVARTFERLRRENPERNVSAAMVWKNLRNKNPPSIRKVEQLVSKFKREGTLLNDSPWKPIWPDADKNPERMARLLELQGAFLGLMGRPMYQSEGDWAGRLYNSLGDLHPFGQIAYIALYAQRENIATLTGGELNTADLDGLLAISIPFSPEEHWRAVELNLVPKPPTTEQLIEVFELEGSEKSLELFRVFGDLFVDYSANPLGAIQKFVGEKGPSAMKRAIWNRTRPSADQSTDVPLFVPERD